MESAKKKIIMVIMLVAGVLAVSFVYNDAFLYDTTIGRVISVENSFSHDEEGTNGEIEHYYDQLLTIKILNGDHKGNIIDIRNTYTSSGVNDERYRKGTQLLLALNKAGDRGSVLEKKRDVYVALFFFAFAFLLVLVSGRHGSIVLISFIINMALLVLSLKAYDTYGNLLRVTMVVMLAFSILTLLFAGGLSKKTFVAILSTLVTVFLCYGIYMLTMKTSERIPYEMMDYMVNSKDLADLFLAGTLMGGLGAVMDVCISIAASVSEVVNKTQDITVKALVTSIREMGYDIMGTMINVLFFTYLSGTIPILVLKIKNGYTLYHLVKFQLFFEMICFLIGAIGIVFAIPVSGFLSALFLGNLRGHNKAITADNKGEGAGK